MAKPLTIIFYQNDSAAAKALAAKLRTPEVNVTLRDASILDGQDCARAIIMPDVVRFIRGRIHRIYINAEDHTNGLVPLKFADLNLAEAPMKHPRKRAAARR